MTIEDTARAKRDKRGPEWVAIATATDGDEIVQYVVPVNGLVDAAHTAATIAHLVEKYERPEPAYFTQLTLRSWRIEISLALEKGNPTPAQQELMTAISELFTAG